VKNHTDKRYTAVALTAPGIMVYEEYLRVDQIRREKVNAYMEIFNESELEAVLKYELLIKKVCSDFLNIQTP
jgi:hypothetical protein